MPEEGIRVPISTIKWVGGGESIPQRLVLPFGEFLQRITTHRITDEKTGELWSPALFHEGRRKEVGNVIEVALLGFDMDSHGKVTPGCDPRPWKRYEEGWRRHGLAYAVHTTFSHSQDSPCWRVVFFLSAAVPLCDWKAFWAASNRLLMGGDADPACKDASRFYYWPMCPRVREEMRYAHFESGAALDPALVPPLPAPPPLTFVDSGPERSAPIRYWVNRALAKVRSGEGRNVVGYWMAQQLYYAGYSRDEILQCGYPQACPGENAKGVPEPYTQEEFEHSVDSAMKLPKLPPAGFIRRVRADNEANPETAEPLGEADVAEARLQGMPAFSLDDTGNAQRVAYRYGHLVRYVEEIKKWAVWNGRRWHIDRHKAHVLVMDMIDLLPQEVHRHRELGEADMKRFVGHVAKARSARGTRDMMEKLQHVAETHCVIGDLDRQPMLINMENATVEVETNIIRPHSAADMLTKCFPFLFNPKATCPVWEAFLDRIMDGDDEMVGFLRRAAGYSLTGSLRDQYLFFLFGGGANGKSTFINTLMRLWGEYAVKAPSGTFVHVRSDADRNTARLDLAMMRGVRMVVGAELHDTDRLDEALIKDMTGGDPITTRHLYGEPFSYQPEFKVWLYGNHKPIIRNQDNGIWRRVLPIPFEVHIAEGERDGALPEKLMVESQGILRWCVQGMLEWKRDGLRIPAKVLAANASYQAEMDVLSEFFSDYCVLGLGNQVSRNALYARYKRWCEESGQSPYSSRRFAVEIQNRGVGIAPGDVIRGERHWSGVGLLSEYGKVALA